MTDLDNGSFGGVPASVGAARWRPRGGWGIVVLGAVAIAAVIVAAVTTPGFVTLSNVQAILASMSFTGLVAVGMTFIMINGNIFSLSLGTAVALSAIVFTAALPLGIPLAAVLAIAVSVAVNAVQGAIIGGAGANSIVVTIAAASLIEGITSWGTGGRSLVPPPGTDLSGLKATFGGFPLSILVLVVAAAIAQLVLTRSPFGRRVFLVGSSTPAAAAAGIPVVRTTVMVFGLAGATAAIAGILLAALNSNATLGMSGTYNYDAVAAAVVGGTAVAGGRGSVLRTMAGAVFITTVGDIMLLRNYGLGPQILVKGVMVVIFVILLNNQLRRAR